MRFDKEYFEKEINNVEEKYHNMAEEWLDQLCDCVGWKCKKPFSSQDVMALWLKKVNL